MKYLHIITFITAKLVFAQSDLPILYKACPDAVTIPPTKNFMPLGSQPGGTWLRLGSLSKRLRCDWVIYTPDPQKYDINILYLEMFLQGPKRDGQCTNQKLHIYYRNVKPQAYCKQLYPHDKLSYNGNVKISSKQTGMSFPFYMNLYIEATTKGCASDVAMKDGQLSYFFQNKAQPNKHCIWFLPEVKKSKILYLIFLNITLNHKKNMEYSCVAYHDEALWVTQWRQNNASIVWKLCTSYFHYPLVVSLLESQRSSVTLHTNRYSTLPSFSATGFLSDQDCGGNSYNQSGTISPPMSNSKYGVDGGYANNKRCVWLLQTNIAYSMLNTYLVFHYLDLEHTHGCVHDYVEIFELTNATSPYQSSVKYCNEMNVKIPQQNRYEQNVILRFISDSGINKKGFEISYFRSAKDCKGTPFTKVSNSYHNILRHNTSSPNQMCSWFYYADREFVLNVQLFITVNLATSHCTGNRLSIYTGVLGTKAKPSYMLCRNRSLRIKASRVLLVFETDSDIFARILEARMMFYFESIPPQFTSSISPTSASASYPFSTSIILPTVKSENSVQEKKFNFLYFIIAGVAVLIIFIVVLLLCLRRRKNRAVKQAKNCSAKPTAPLDMSKRPSEIPLVDTIASKKSNSLKKILKNKLQSSFGSHIDESKFDWQDNDSDVVVNEHVKLDSGSFSENKEEAICEMYESKEENRNSQISISSEDLERRRQSGDAVGQIFYGEEKGDKKSSKRPDSYIFHSNTLELDDSTIPKRPITYSRDVQDDLKKEVPSSTANIVLHDVISQMPQQKSLSASNMYDAMNEKENLETKDRSSTNDLYDSMNENELRSLKENRSSSNNLYGSTTKETTTPTSKPSTVVYHGLTMSSSHEDDYADLDDENYACPDSQTYKKEQDNPQYAGTTPVLVDNLYASPGSYYQKDNPLYE
ncbi:uncharacterized protein LOC130648999 isoform X2 [Hydractinia symbiolongicarpus]|uniref:uncharacterized protein LOC130648999 isoform X2 n=1 Tax=Hydractinia symbiolongicarpus TaxID=13093 RepID=UPI00255058FC|nr:uncharacterized protein LOC130648999 isoform X2 [Hydractinia symbiolongicarpus]